MLVLSVSHSLVLTTKIELPSPIIKLILKENLTNE